jgi:AraC-like DNA-binding protein
MQSLRRRLGPAPEWRPFRDYVLSLHRELPHLGTEYAVRHAPDLALFAFGAGGDAREVARGRGLRHARLVALKADIDRHLTSDRPRLGRLASQHGISERYIRALFADEDMGFNDYVAGQRLALTPRRLTDPASAARSVCQVAFTSGCGDISWFNARFRRAFGMTPTEARRWRPGGVPDRGRRYGPITELFRVRITPTGPNDFLIPTCAAPSPAGEDPGSLEEGYACPGPDDCFIDDPTGLSFVLPAGWTSDLPFLAETAGGVAASAPTATFTGPDGQLLLLNPIRWIESNGTCSRTAVGDFCMFGAPPMAWR